MQNHPTLLSRLLRREFSLAVACPVNSVSWSEERRELVVAGKGKVGG